MKKWIALLLCGMLVWMSLASAMAQGFAGLMDDEASAGTGASGMAGLMDDEAEEKESSDPVFTLPYPVNSDSAQALEPSQERIESTKQNGKATTDTIWISGRIFSTPRRALRC